MPGIVVPAGNPSTWEAEDKEFKGYIVSGRPDKLYDTRAGGGGGRRGAKVKEQ